MKHSPRNDRIFSTASWIIVFALIFSMVFMWVDLPNASGPVASILGVYGAAIFYTCIYGIEGLLLGYAKLFKKKKLRKGVLLAIFYTAIFTAILSVTLNGVYVGVIDNLLLALMSGGCFLYWKFKTEYLDPDVFQEEILEIRRNESP